MREASLPLLSQGQEGDGWECGKANVREREPKIAIWLWSPFAVWVATGLCLLKTQRSADLCPTPTLVPIGTKIGEVLRDMTLYDCDARAVKLADLCGAKALWLSFHHTWCPHCRLLRDTMERVHTSYAGKDLASVAIVVQTNSRTRPDAQTCKDWKRTYAHKSSAHLALDGRMKRALGGEVFVVWVKKFLCIAKK